MSCSRMHDVDAGVELLQWNAVHMPGVATAQDHDIGGGVGRQRGRGLARELRVSERLGEPPARPASAGIEIGGVAEVAEVAAMSNQGR